jgi:hypothetical protein
MIDTIQKGKVVSLLTPIMANNTAEGTGVAKDRWGYGDVLMIAHVGISGDTLSGSVYWTIAFQECATTTAGSFTTIAQADLEGGTPTWVINEPTEDDMTITRLYRGSLRYVRILFTQTGTHTNGTPISAVAIMGQPNHIPVTQDTEVQA